MKVESNSSNDHGGSPEDIRVFARGLGGSYGEAAYQYAVNIAGELRSVGDHIGEAVWLDVSMRINALDPDNSAT